MTELGGYIKIQICPCGWFPHGFPSPPVVAVCPKCGYESLSWMVGRYVYMKTGNLFSRQAIVAFRRKSDNLDLPAI